ncbi:MAG: chromate efflux transporter [Leptolyngbya sp. SIO4C1]|nr:chromate efflux transporter [Leptolyngbya sp. SIO4C1]
MPQQRLIVLSRLFAKLGIIGFGGPQAHIAMVSDEAVDRRGWLTAAQFSDGLAVCEMLPGPASTQLGIYIGYVYGGWAGALVAGVSFIAPAFVIVVALAWVYFRFAQLPQLEALFFGLAPVMIAIILGFCWKLGRKSLKDAVGIAIALSAFLISSFTALSTLLMFVMFGLIGLLVYSRDAIALLTIPLLVQTPPTASEPLSQSSVWGTERIVSFWGPLLFFFLKVGAFIFGGGLVIIPLLEFEVVDRLHWLTRSEFIDGIAIGQLSPGPVVITAAFVGYKVAGVLGALISTIGIFTPSFVFILLAAPVLLRLRENQSVQAFLHGVRPAVLGAIAAAAVPLSETAFLQSSVPLSGLAIAIGLAALAAIIRFRVTTWKLILAGGLVGLVGYPLLAG